MSQQPNALWCTVVETRTGARCRVWVRNDAGSWPQTLGSAADDGIRIDLGAMPPHAIRIVPSGSHLSVTAQVPDLVHVRGERLAAGSSRRVDGAFSIGTLFVTFQHGGCDDEEE